DQGQSNGRERSQEHTYFTSASQWYRERYRSPSRQSLPEDAYKGGVRCGRLLARQLQAKLMAEQRIEAVLGGFLASNERAALPETALEFLIGWRNMRPS